MDPQDAHACPAGEEKLNAEGELAVARLVMDGGDLKHAATHVGNALAESPALPEVFETLAELAARAGGPEKAVDLFAGSDYIGAVACRAHLLASALRWPEAVEVLSSVVAHAPRLPWALVPWTAREDLAALAGTQSVVTALSRLVGAGWPDPLPEPLRANVAPFLELARAAVAAEPDHTRLLGGASGLARRFAAHEDAVAWARRAHEVEPGYFPAVMYGYALRAAGSADEALAVWEAAVSAEADLSLYVDIAELYADTGRPEPAVAWLERALAADPAHPLAGPALHGVRFGADGDRAHLVALVDHLRERPEQGYAATVLGRRCAGLPWLSGVTAGREATVNVLRRMAEKGAAADSSISLTCSGIEAPSALLAMRQAFPGAEVRITGVPEPDPRLPSADVTTAVWRYEDRLGVPAVPAPDPRAAEAVRACAQPFWPSPPAAYDHAVRLAGVPLADLLGVLVHPPAPRDDEQGRRLAGGFADLWIRGVQVFACLAIAHHATDEPWDGSTRHRVLVDLLNGPEDWVTEAAGFALLAVAWGDPDTREDIGRHLVERMLAAADARRTRPVEVLPSLAHYVLACPWLEDTFTSLAATLLERVRRQDEAEPDPAETEERGRRLLEGAEPDAAGGAVPDAAPDPVPAPAPEPAPRKGLLGRLRRDG